MSVIWKGLIYRGEDFSSRFEISNDGYLRNVVTGTVYKRTVNAQGYYAVTVSLGSRSCKKLIKIHIAVADTFIPNPYNKPYVNHKDGVKLNVHESNLEWATPKENSAHAIETGLMVHAKGLNHSCSKVCGEDVREIRKLYIPGDMEFGSRALARKFNVSYTTISAIASGKRYKDVV